MTEQLEKLIGYLNQAKVRCTYGAVAELLGIRAQSVGDVLGPRRPEVSWVVNARTGEPTGYNDDEKHPELYSHEEVIRRGTDLRARMERLPS